MVRVSLMVQVIEDKQMCSSLVNLLCFPQVICNFVLKCLVNSLRLFVSGGTGTEPRTVHL